MSRKMDVDWSDWKGSANAPEHSLSRPVDVGSKGADVAKDLNNLVKSIIEDGKKTQPTKEQFEAAIAARLPSEEQMKKAANDWENRFKNHFDLLSKPIDHLNKSTIDHKKWKNGKSFNDMLKEELSEADLAARNSDTTDL